MTKSVYVHRDLICSDCGNIVKSKLICLSKEYNCEVCSGMLVEFKYTNIKRSNTFNSPNFISVHNMNNKLPSQYKEFQKEFKHRHRYVRNSQIDNW